MTGVVGSSTVKIAARLTTKPNALKTTALYMPALVREKLGIVSVAFVAPGTALGPKIQR
jgi:hypothetical protein